MTRLDHTTIRMGSLYRARPDHISRYEKYGPVQGPETPSRAWRIAAAVVVGVGAGFAGWWL